MKRILCILLVLCLFAGCRREEKHQKTFLAMDTVMTVTYYGGDDSLLDQANALVEDLESKLSTTREGSDIFRINSAGNGKISGETEMILKKALHVCEKTEGALDISLYPVLKAWGFTTGSYQVPGEEALQSLLSQAGYEKIRLEGNQVSIPEGMELDLGSIAKGYTGDAILAMLKAEGITSAMVDLGGNIQTLGGKPGNTPWKIALKNPSGEGYLGYLSLAGQTAITSGSYERFFEENGRRYWHILDRETGFPADSGLVSVTVVGEDGALCDGLSTALFVMGKEKGLAFWRDSQDFEAIFVEENGNITVTNGIADIFSPEAGITWEVAEK